MSRLALPVSHPTQQSAGGLAYVAVGTGPTVVFVPGYTGSKEDFGPLLAPLADAGFHVVAIDQRGQHESVGPDDPASYTVARLADDLLALCAEVGGGDAVHLVGHSFGGIVSRAATIARPAAVRSLVLLDSGPAALGGQRAMLMRFLQPMVEAGGVEALVAAQAELAAQVPGYDPPPPDAAAFQTARMLASASAALLGMGEALLGEPDRVAELKAVGLPMLVVSGEHDDAWPPDVQADMAERLGVDFVTIPDAVHSPAVENPDATVPVLLDFWRR